MNEILHSAIGRTTVEAELNEDAAVVRLMSLDLVKKGSHILHEDNALRLDLSVGRRLPGSVIHIEDHWEPSRYEPPGRLFLLPPHATMRVKNGVGRQSAIVCWLPVSTLAAWFDAEVDWNGSRLDAGLDVDCQTVNDLMFRLGAEARNPGFAGKILIEGIALQIAVTLERFYRAAPATCQPGGLSVSRLRLLDERITDMATMPSLSELAALCGLSVRHLSRAFRISRDEPLGRYVARVRTEVAMRLLAEGLSVKTVAYRMGFPSPASFSNAFKLMTGRSPSSFGAGDNRLN